MYYLGGVFLGITSVDQLVLPDRAEAMEVHVSAATVPVEFNSTGPSCGVILLWTRRSP